MKRLIAALLAMMLVLSCSTAMAMTYGEAAQAYLAQAKIPLTVDEIPVTPPLEPKRAAYTLTYEDGYYVVKTGWFDLFEQAGKNSVELQIDNTRAACIYDAERAAYISSKSMEEGRMEYLFFSIRYEQPDGCYDSVSWQTRYGSSWDAPDAYTERMAVNSYHTDTAAAYQSKIYDVFAYGSADGKIVMTDWLRDYSINGLSVFCQTTFFEANGKATDYSYEMLSGNNGILIHTDYVAYDMNGTLLDASIYVNNQLYFYCYYGDGWPDEWFDDNYNECDPPEGYSRAKLYELYPPLVGSIPDLSIPGDADNDGKVEVNDALALIKNLAGDKVDTFSPAADVNEDDVVDMKDILMILQHVAGWLVELK